MVLKTRQVNNGTVGTVTGVTATAAEINTLSGISAVVAELNYNDITTLGTGAASKAVVLDSTGNYTLPASHTFRRTPVGLTATASITALLHSNRVLVMTGSGSAAAYTLPAATGTGDKYTFIMGQVNTSGTTIVTATLASESFYGSINNLDVDSNAQTAYFTATAGGTDTITLNGTTKGGQIGDIIEVTDIATGKWAVTGTVRCPAGSNVASMFSDAG